MVGDFEDFQNWALAHEYDTAGDLAQEDGETALTRATAVVSGLLNRRLDPVEDATHYVRGYGTRELCLPDFLEISAVTIGDTAFTSYRTAPYNTTPIQLLERTDGAVFGNGVEVAITGTLGYYALANMPRDIVEAVYTLAARGLWEPIGSVRSVSIQGVSVTVQSEADFLQEIRQNLAHHVRFF